MNAGADAFGGMVCCVYLQVWQDPMAWGRAKADVVRQGRVKILWPSTRPLTLLCTDGRVSQDQTPQEIMQKLNLFSLNHHHNQQEQKG